MGGFFGGLASAIGGAQQPLQEYGQQVRAIAEQRRGALSNFFVQQATVEQDPQKRAELLDHARGAIMDPWKTLIPKVAKTVQSHVDDNNALAQAAGGPPSPSIPTAGAPPGPGQTPGSTTQPPTAAQPSTSLVQPRSPIGGAGVGVGNLPIPGTPPGVANEQAPTQVSPIAGAAAVDPMDAALAKKREIIARYNGLLQNATPAMRPIIQQQMQDELANFQPFEQAAYRQSNLSKMRADPGYVEEPRSLGEWSRQNDLRAAYGFQPMPLTGIMSSLTKPLPMLQQTADSVIKRWPQQAKEAGIKPGGDPVDVWVDRLTEEPVSIGGHAFRKSVTEGYNSEGNPIMMLENPYGPEGPMPTVGQGTPTPRSQNSSIVKPTAGGGVAVTTPNAVRQGIPPVAAQGLVTPGLQTKETDTTTVPTEVGGTQVHRVTSVVPPVGGSAAGGTAGRSTTPAAGTPKPSQAGSSQKSQPSVWANVRAFDDSVPVDHIVRQIAQDAANVKMISTRGPFSDSNPSKNMVNKRMAELGLDPNNVSGSVRDRAAIAATVLPRIDDLVKLIHEAQDHGQLGVVMNRLNDIALHGAGIDVTTNNLYSKQATDLAFAISAIAMTHGGAKAGGSLPVIEHWKKALGAKDPGTLVSELGEARKWMQGYAEMAGPSKPVKTGGTTITPATGGRPPLSSFGH